MFYVYLTIGHGKSAQRVIDFIYMSVLLFYNNYLYVIISITQVHYGKNSQSIHHNRLCFTPLFL